MNIQKIEQEVKRRNQLIANITFRHPQLLEQSEVLPPIIQATVQQTLVKDQLDLEMKLLKRIDSLMQKARAPLAVNQTKKQYKQLNSSSHSSPYSLAKNRKKQFQDSLYVTSKFGQPLANKVYQQQNIDIQYEQKTIQKNFPSPKNIQRDIIKKLKQQRTNIQQNKVKQPIIQLQPQQMQQKNMSQLQYSVSMVSMAPFNFQPQRDDILQQLIKQEQDIVNELQQINQKIQKMNK